MQTFGFLVLCFLAVVVANAQGTNVAVVNSHHLVSISKHMGSNGYYYPSDSTLEANKANSAATYKTIQLTSAFFVQPTKLVWVEPSIMESHIDGVIISPTSKTISLPTFVNNIILVKHDLIKRTDLRDGLTTITYQ